MKRCWSLGLGALLCACGSAGAPIETIVSIDAEPAVRAVTARLAVDIRSLSGDYHKALTPEPNWPLKFVLAPEHDDASRRFSIEVAALNQESDRLLAFSIASGFRRSGAAYAKLVVDDRCIDAADACTSMDCNSEVIDGDALGRSRDHALVVHVDCTGAPDLPDGGMLPAAGSGAAGSGGEPTGAAGSDATAGSRSQAGQPSGGTGGAGAAGGAAGAAGSAPAPGACEKGYERVGADCVDIDECAKEPCGHGGCVNQRGGYACMCDAGYVAQGGTCVSESPCAIGNGGCSDTCRVSAGRAVCECPTDGWLKADGKSCGRLGAAMPLSSQASLVRAQPQLAFDGKGKAWALWIQAAEDGLSLWEAHAEPGAGFGPAAKLPLTGIAPVRSPRIVTSADASLGLVLWLQQNSDQTSFELWSASQQNGVWGTAARIDGEFGAVSDPVLALDKNGSAVAAWMETRGTRTEVWMSRWSALKREWGKAYHLAGTDTVDAWWPRLSLDANGGGALVWTQAEVVDGTTDPTTASLWGAHLNLVSNADPKTLLLAATSAQADVAIKPDGTGLLVWLGYADQAFAVLANGYRPDMGLEPSTRSSLVSLEPAMDTTMQPFPLAPRVALNANGDGVAMWVELRDSTSTVWGTTYDPAAGAWAMSQKLSPQESVLPGWTDTVVESVLTLALDEQGNGVTAWSDFATDFKRDVWMQPVRAKTGFLNRVHVVVADSVPKQSSRVEAAVDGAGHGFLIWDVQNNSRYEVWASRLE